MWDGAKSHRFQDLRRRELDGNLAEAEETELARLTQELEDLEAATLAPAVERSRQENARLRAEAERLLRQRQDLTELLAQKEAYLARARSMVEELETERRD